MVRRGARHRQMVLTDDTAGGIPCVYGPGMYNIAYQNDRLTVREGTEVILCVILYLKNTKTCHG